MYGKLKKLIGLTNTRKSRIHFLHIGKTGGTAIRHALKGVEIAGGHRLVLHSHPTVLRDIPVGEQVVFFLRDPVARFKSGFLSRQRKGQPRYDVPWTTAEQTAFQQFSTPNQLGLALGSDDPRIRQEAEDAMCGINHVRFRYADWFGDQPYLESRKNDLFFVGFQETLSADFLALVQKLGLPARFCLPQDPIAAHRTPARLTETLEPAAVENLKQYLRADYECLNWCKGVAPQINRPV